jgi:hypothetical protein
MRALNKTVFFLFLLSVSSLTIKSQELGLNFNHNPENIDFDYVKKTGVTWIRTTPRILDYVDRNIDVKTDSAIQNVVEAGKLGYKIAFGFRWDFNRRKLALPAPGSVREAEYFRTMDAILDRVGPYIQIFKLGNEPNLETIESDLQYDDQHHVPLVEFNKSQLQHVLQYYKKHPTWKKPQIYAGSLPALFEKKQQEKPGVFELIKFVQSNPEVTGLAVHLHIADTLEIPQALKFVRNIMPTKPIIIPEFSLFRLYNKHFKDEIGLSDEGKAFVAKYNYPEHITVSEWLTLVNARKAPITQFQEMFDSQKWYPQHYLKTYQRYYKQYGVVLATYPLFQQGYAKYVKPDSESWFLNPIYLNKSYGVAENGEFVKNPLSYDDFINWVKKHNKP